MTEQNTQPAAKELYLQAPAKINLGLDVTGKRPNGYHDLRMIMQTVKLHDEVYLKRTKASGIRMETNLRYIPSDQNNLVWKAAQLLLEEFPQEDGVFIKLTKRIPVAAGLAGGSSDAAAVLMGVNRLFDLGLSRQELMDRGVKIGADVPYCIMGGTALAEGIGEELTPLPAPPTCKVVLAKPPIHVSTKEVYGALHLDDSTVHPPIDTQIEALRAGDLTALCRNMGNVLEDVTIPGHPEVAALKEAMLQGGADGAMMSGSGPTVFGLFADEKLAFRTADALIKDFEGCSVFVTDLLSPAV